MSEANERGGMYPAADRLKKEFGDCIGDGDSDFGHISYRQIWFIVKVAKVARLYCRGNVAFNNFFNAIFGEVAEFKQVIKTKPGGEKYEGLQITMVNRNDATEYADNTIEEGDDNEQD